LAFDRAGNLYASNYTTDTVTVYPPGGSSLLRTISKGISAPGHLAFGP